MCLSVLLSVYKNEQPQYLSAALQSIWNAQEKKPGEIVLVVDGPISRELGFVIENWQTSLGNTLVVIRLPTNVGLAAALNKGLNYCRYDLVARMDTDDVSMPSRFLNQLAFMHANPDIAVCSGTIEEYSEDMATRLFVRTLPITHDQIYRFAKRRSPISHPAAIFRKAAVIAVGGYPLIYPEDYPLWGRMLVSGYKFANLQEVLLKMRVGDALYRRRGVQFLKGEIAVFRYLNELGFLTKSEMLRNIIERAVLRLSPTKAKKLMYKYFR